MVRETDENPPKSSVRLVYVGDLNFGDGPYASPLTETVQKQELAFRLSGYVRRVTGTKMADCIDDRLILRLASGVNDPQILLARVVYQQPGGTYLHFTKAAVAAGLDIVKDAKSIKQAYETIGRIFDSHGWQDGGHAGCGASKFVLASVTKPITDIDLIGAVDLMFGPVGFASDMPKVVSAVQKNKRQKLDAGFYNNWSSDWHEDRLQETVPNNFSFLETQHLPSGLLVVKKQNMGLAKNQLIQATNTRVFASTTGQYPEAIDLLCSTATDKARFMVALVDDLCTVSQTLIKPGLPVIVQAA